MVRLLPPPSRDQGNRTRERQQKTLVGLRESFLTAAPGLKAHLEAEPSARPVPLPGHCRLPPRLVLPAQVEMMASTQQHSLVRLAGAAPHTTESARNPMLLEQHCPPRDQHLARERRNHGGLARALGGLGARPVPLHECAVFLEPEEPPGELDQATAHTSVSRLRQPPLPALGAALVGRSREPGIARYRSSIPQVA